MNIKWINATKKLPTCTDSLRDFIFIVSDGLDMTLARWVNLCCEDPNSGADCDEYEFYPLREIKILFWYGPVADEMDKIPPFGQ